MRMLFLGTAFALMAAAPVAAAAAPKHPKSIAVSITLPASNAELPPGAGVQTVRQNCVACHSADMLLTQPALPRTVWEAEVTKMRKIYKAPVADADVPAIVAYLTGLKLAP